MFERRKFKRGVEVPRTVALHVTEEAQPHVLQKKMLEAGVPHAAPVLATIVGARVFLNGEVRFCNVQKIILHQVVIGHGDAGEIPSACTITGFALPGESCNLPAVIFANGVTAIRVVVSIAAAQQALAL